MPDGLNLTCAGGLQLAQALACGLLGILVALPLVFEFQAGPFIRIHGADVRSIELAIRCGKCCEQRGVGPANEWFGIRLFRVSMGARGGTNRSRLDFVSG